MRPMKILTNWFEQHANSDRYLFLSSDIRALCPDISDAAFKVLLSRMAKTDGPLERVCRGLYSYKKTADKSLILFHAAAQLRSDAFNYISLETLLSDVGVISQIPMNFVSIMSSGRSSLIKCGALGTIEFVHTDTKASDVYEELSYDPVRRMWKANVKLALRDMKKTKRNCDLIDWEVANELIR